MPMNFLMDKVRAFLGIPPELPRNDFRNPIWGDDDDDDGDELYERQAHINVFTDPNLLQSEITRQMFDMFKTFGNFFSDAMEGFDEQQLNSLGDTTDLTPDTVDEFNNCNLRDYYLKPGYHSEQPREDEDLDGKISSQEISGMLKNKGDHRNGNSLIPFGGNIVSGGSFCKTIITTSIRKPDGTVETKRIVKNGNEVTEETITTTTSQSGPGDQSPLRPGMTPTPADLFYQNVLSDLASTWRNFN